MKIALAQINPLIGDVRGNREKIISNICEAVNKGADLVIFPEMATIGYPPMDLLCNHKLIDENIESINEISKLSGGIGIICGFVDRDKSASPPLYNAAAFINEGVIKSVHHKKLLPEYDVFDENRYFSAGEKTETVFFKEKKIGITICEDIWNELDYDKRDYIEQRKYNTSPVRDLLKENIDLLVNISASPFVTDKNTSKWRMIKTIANKNSIQIAYVNQVGGNDSLIFDGKSFFANTDGRFTAIAGGFSEDLIVVDDESSETADPFNEGMEDIRKALVLGLRDYVHKCGFRKVLLGLSGGIDSALTAAIAVDALGPDNVLGITMPSQFSSPGSVNDSVELAKNLGMRIENIPISGTFKNYKETLSDIFKGLKEDVTEENIQARIRGNILMALSNKFGSLLLTTGNKSELAMGYCTLYGDMAGGLAVISDLPKTLVYELSEHYNSGREVIPRAIIEKAPSAELRENQRDQDSLPPYEILDGILKLYIEKLMSSDEIIDAGYNKETVDFVLRTVDKTEYKRRQAPPGLKVTSKAFGSGRRIPVAQKFKP